MGRRDAEPRKGNTQGSNAEGLAGIHGKDRKELRRLAKYAAMGQEPQSLTGGMESLFGQVIQPENGDKPKI